ncbi:Ger(x)C family spore germination protein [Alkalihalobacillus oceani]|uniref:Ger(X)C family spore germination protein n=1 Tax=Halalkalibacter oceani TaxID=1653776 RepID=A0A9X2DQJ9_9BACI|nr:Ger(x)C family spore germination protein [Halalkalibacter oceani]MCM3713308.1 Ger(x)C family spore germination protein [Halalkalibacter oceani]
MNFSYKGGLVLLFFLLLSGCWNAKELGEESYVTAIGIDFHDGRYTIYTQLLDFSSIVTQENNKAAEPIPLYIGEVSGRTINDAIFDLYRTSQIPINWAHIGTIVYSESVLEHGLEEVHESLQKNGEFRYTPWVFGTKNSIREILTITGFFQLPPLYTILYSPEKMFDMNSYIEPKRLHTFIAEYKEAGKISLLPSISINKTQWSQSAKALEPKNTLIIDGAFPIDSQKGLAKEWLSFAELVGKRWLLDTADNIPLDFYEGGEIKGSVNVTDTKGEVEVTTNGNKAEFTVTVKASGSLTDLEEDLSLDTIEQLITRQIEEEIRQTYNKAIEKEADVYYVKNKLFHQGTKPDKLNEYMLDNDSLKQITVDFHLRSKGPYN